MEVSTLSWDTNEGITREQGLGAPCLADVLPLSLCALLIHDYSHRLVAEVMDKVIGGES